MTAMIRSCCWGLGRLALIACALSMSAAMLPTARAEARKKAAGSTQKSLSQTLTGTAKADFEAGKLLANDGDYAGALIKFTNAFEAAKDPRLLWNLAFCQKNLRHYAKVLSILRRYLEEGGSVLTSADRAEAQNLITLIEPFTTRVAFQVTPDGATIMVDDELVGTSPLSSPVVLDIGERRVRVTKAGYRPLEKALAVGGTSEVAFQAELEREVHEGRLLVNAPNHAQIFLDGKQVAMGKLDLVVASGGHQLRVIAPGTRPYQTEVVVSDRETRSVEVVLEAAAPPAKPRMHVAVGCADARPRGPDEGLVVHWDGTDVLSPVLVKKRHDDRLGKDVVEHVEYEVSQGRHSVRVNITDCQPSEAEANVAPDGGTEIMGALRSDRSVLLRGPLGSPGWYRLALGLWLPTGRLGNNGSIPENYTGAFGNLVGASLDVGLVGRWFALFVTGSWAKGTFDRDTHQTHIALPQSATTSWKQLSLRLGPRLPFNVVALGLGAQLNVQGIDLSQVRTGHVSSAADGFLELDVQPLCDWGIYVLGNLGHNISDDGWVDAALSVGLMYQPSARCHAERETRFGLTVRP
jgi:hypothetical protein